MHLNLLFFKIKYIHEDTQNDRKIKNIFKLSWSIFNITPVCEIICKFKVKRNRMKTTIY